VVLQTQATPAYFPDATLEGAVSEAIGVDPSRLTKELLADRLISFELNGAEVRDLSGLGDAKNLEVLTLRHNLIEDLSPLGGLPKLQRLELRGNRMQSLESLKGLTALAELDLSQNRLKGLAGAEILVHLRKLEVNENELRDLSGISKLKKLEILHAQGNKLGVPEPFDDQNDNGSFDEGEDFVDLSGNGIWDNDPLPELDQLPLLREVYLYGNGLSALSGFGDLPALRTLLLGVNEITDISPLKNFTSLRNLSLNRNKVTDIGSLVDLDALVYLDLSENRLSDLRPLRRMKSLRTLSLNDNNLTDLRPLAKHPHLENLSFNSNLVSDLRPLANLKKLRDLDAGRNLIDLDSAWNLSVAEVFSRNKVRTRTVGQTKMIDGLRELGEALIGDKGSSARLGAYLNENGFERLRDYHADSQLAEAKKIDSYREWIKAIRDDEIDELPPLRKR